MPFHLSLAATTTPAQGATQGQRLEKLLAHDFSSPRGRSVAEKNAYILLRKRKFKSAAAVFLLPRPAMLKEALQVGVQQACLGEGGGGGGGGGGGEGEEHERAHETKYHRG